MVELQPSKLITRVRFPPPASLSSRAHHELDERIERAVGSAPVRYTARPGGYSTADRYTVELADGRRIFVKSAEEANLAGWLRREHEVYSSVEGVFIPRLEGWDDDGTRPVLAIEDLSDADWVPRWDAARVDAVVAALAEIAASAHPANTYPVGETFPHLFDRWADVAHDPEPFLSAGIRDRAWLDRVAPRDHRRCRDRRLIRELTVASRRAQRQPLLSRRAGDLRRLELGDRRQSSARRHSVASEPRL